MGKGLKDGADSDSYRSQGKEKTRVRSKQGGKAVFPYCKRSVCSACGVGTGRLDPEESGGGWIQRFELGFNLPVAIAILDAFT